MDVKNLDYQEKLQILKDIFDSTNIILTSYYGAWSIIKSDSIKFISELPTFIVDENNDYEDSRCTFDEEDKSAPYLIGINTYIYTG